MSLGRRRAVNLSGRLGRPRHEFARHRRFRRRLEQRFASFGVRPLADEAPAHVLEPVVKRIPDRSSRVPQGVLQAILHRIGLQIRDEGFRGVAAPRLVPGISPQAQFLASLFALAAVLCERGLEQWNGRAIILSDDQIEVRLDLRVKASFPVQVLADLRVGLFDGKFGLDVGDGHDRLERDSRVVTVLRDAFQIVRSAETSQSVDRRADGPQRRRRADLDAA